MGAVLLSSKTAPYTDIEDQEVLVCVEDTVEDWYHHLKDLVDIEQQGNIINNAREYCEKRYSVKNAISPLINELSSLPVQMATDFLDTGENRGDDRIVVGGAGTETLHGRTLTEKPNLGTCSAIMTTNSILVSSGGRLLLDQMALQGLYNRATRFLLSEDIPTSGYVEYIINVNSPFVLFYVTTDRSTSLLTEIVQDGCIMLQQIININCDGVYAINTENSTLQGICSVRFKPFNSTIRLLLKKGNKPGRQDNCSLAYATSRLYIQ
jgi:hypothetical protein